MTLKPTLNLRLLEMKGSNIGLHTIVKGLEKFKADLEAKGVKVSITITDQSDDQTEPKIVLLETESEGTK